MDFLRAANLLLSQDYKFAKTMPEHPHSYTLIYNWKNKQDFYDVVEFIRENSYPEKFKGRTYRMFLLNGMKYWTMGAPIKETILINRAVASLPALYDKIAEKYVDLFTEEKFISEDKKLIEIINPTGRILDIGCGTGMILNYVTPEPSDYIGIDPCKQMLNNFSMLHPDYSENVINCKFEYFYNFSRFDTIMALYGTASYIKPKYIDRILEFLMPGGTVHLMYYAPDYFPETYNATNVILEREEIYNGEIMLSDQFSFKRGTFNGKYILIQIKKNL